MSSFLAIQSEVLLQDPSIETTNPQTQQINIESEHAPITSIGLRCLGELSSHCMLHDQGLTPTVPPQIPHLLCKIPVLQADDANSLILYVRSQLSAPTPRPSPIDMVRMTAIARPMHTLPTASASKTSSPETTYRFPNLPIKGATIENDRQESRVESEKLPLKNVILIDQSPIHKWIHPVGLSVSPFYQERDSSSEREWEEIEEQEGVGRKKKTSVLAPFTDAASPRPVLEPPKIGIFAVYYILTKLGILSDAASHWESKQSIEATDSEMKELYRARIAELKKALEYEKANKLWGLTLKMMNWMMALTGIIAGITLVLSGVGAIAGALLIAGGILALTNQIFEVTGVWNKIAQKLPTNSEEKREATLHWMRIGITILCLVLSCAGALGAGWGALNEAMGNFMAVFGGVVMMGSGVCTIGQGVTMYLHKDRLSNWVTHQRRLAILKHRREDLVEGLEHGVERMKQLFIDLAKLLDFESEIVRASQPLLSR